MKKFIIATFLSLALVACVPSPTTSLPTGCITGQIARWNNTTQSWYCDNDAGGASALATATPQPTPTRVPTATPMPTATVSLAMIDPAMNLSSVGDIYTDTAGNTLAETANQTRVTAAPQRPRSYAAVVSFHVSAGTGTIQFYNVTTSTVLGSTTTTATTAPTTAQLNIVAAPASAGGLVSPSDVLTLRVSNNTPSATVTIDGGGISSGDINIRNASGAVLGSVLASSSGGYISQIKCAVAIATIGATYTVLIQQINSPFGTTAILTPSPPGTSDLVTTALTFTQATSGTVQTFTPITKNYGSSYSVMTTAASGASFTVCAAAMSASAIY